MGQDNRRMITMVLPEYKIGASLAPKPIAKFAIPLGKIILGDDDADR